MNIIDKIKVGSIIEYDDIGILRLMITGIDAVSIRTIVLMDSPSVYRGFDPGCMYIIPIRYIKHITNIIAE